MKKIKTIISMVIITALLIISVPIFSSCDKDRGDISTVPVVSDEKSDELAGKVDHNLVGSNTQWRMQWSLAEWIWRSLTRASVILWSAF